MADDEHCVAGAAWQQLNWDEADGWLYRLDVSLYPCDSPYTPGMLGELFRHVPQLAVALVAQPGGELAQDSAEARDAGVPGDVLGVAVFLALNRAGWQGISQGRLVEGELDERTLFVPGRDTELGVHVYHLHRLCPAVAGFARLAVRELARRVAALRVDVVGFSGLCASRPSLAVFAALGCRERPEHVLCEHVVRPGRDQPLRFVELDPAADTYQQQLDQLAAPDDGGSALRCQMMVWRADDDDRRTLLARLFVG